MRGLDGKVSVRDIGGTRAKVRASVSGTGEDQMLKTMGGGIAIVIVLGCTVVEARELLVGSWATHTVRAYDTDTQQFLGNLVAPRSGGLNTPDGMDFGPDGNLYVSSSGSNAVLKFDGEDGTFLGPFATERLNMPGNLKFGPDGLLYVANKALAKSSGLIPTRAP